MTVGFILHGDIINVRDKGRQDCIATNMEQGEELRGSETLKQVLFKYHISCPNKGGTQCLLSPDYDNQRTKV